MFLTPLLVALAAFSMTPLVSPQGVIASPKGTRRSLRDLSGRCSNNLDKCAFDCDRDCDCKTGFVCYLRERGKGKGRTPSDYNFYGGRRDLKIPGCPTVTPSNFDDDYCIDPKAWPAGTLWYIGSNGSPTNVFPLQECWGDCDIDADCASGLKCFRREGNLPAAVPGCSGDPVRGIDYCYKPPAPLKYVGDCHRHSGKGKGKGGEHHYHDNDGGDVCVPYPLGVCEGDCGASYDCAGDLVCLQRDEYTTTYPVFGCDGTPRDKDTDYCIDPKKIPATNRFLIFWGNNGRWPSSVYPFGRCQGDCDRDSDCKTGLRCVGVDSTGKIPGCEGYIQHRMNYCV